jgi:hypothetical protein
MLVDGGYKAKKRKESFFVWKNNICTLSKKNECDGERKERKSNIIICLLFAEMICAMVKRSENKNKNLLFVLI